MTIFIGGNSHTGALRKAQKRDPDLFPDIHIGPFGSGEFESTAFARTEDGLVRFTVDAYRARLIEISGADIFQPGDTWVVMMGTHTARLLAPAFWSNAAPARLLQDNPRDKRDFRAVSDRLLAEMIAAGQDNVIAFAQDLRRTGVQVLFAACPPLRRSGHVMRAGVHEDVALFVDRLARQQFMTRLEALEIPFVTPPPETIDADGFMAETFAKRFRIDGQRDPHHANPEYGRLMLERVAAKLAELGLRETGKA